MVNKIKHLLSIIFPFLLKNVGLCDIMLQVYKEVQHMKITKKNARIVSILILLIILLTGCIGRREEPQTTITETECPTESNSPASATQVTPKKRVALTYDDGPHNRYTMNIVDELSKYGAHATFFVVGNRLDGTSYNGKAGLQYAISAGNEIGIHGYTHTKYYDSCSDADYEAEQSKTLNEIRNISPATSVALMRPVGGKISNARVKNSEYAIILWDVDSQDWKYKYTASEDATKKEENLSIIVDNIMSTVTDGSIILMHDIYVSTYDATVVILEQLYAEGYEVVTVSELLGDNLSSGVKYFSK